MFMRNGAILIIILFLAGVPAQELKDDKIVGGFISKPGQFPWIVGLWRKNSLYPFCGGSLLNKRWVLTAAHCIYPDRGSSLRLPEIVLGDYDTSDRRNKDKLRKPSCGVKIHPLYRPESQQHDIAVVRLCSDVKYTRRYFPIRLPNPELNLRSGKPLVVGGWGVLQFGNHRPSKILRAVVVRNVDRSTCRRAYGFITKQHICAGSQGKDACQGDSGGPLWYYDSSKRSIIVGVVSTGKGCGNADYPGVYTRVSTHFFWLLNSMAES